MLTIVMENEEGRIGEFKSEGTIPKHPYSLVRPSNSYDLYF